MEEEEKPVRAKRETWKHASEFFLAALGYSVGMGTLTRFPYMVMKNGGGAFLIPFIIVLVIAGIPLFYMELILGQFSARSPLTMWVLCPAFKGIGYSMTLLTFVASIYYMPFTWSVVYFFSSFSSEVPWKTCDNWWNTPRCLDRASMLHINDSDANFTINITNPVSPAEEFFNEYVVDIIPEGWTGFGELKWHVVLAHLFTWVLVFLCCFKGHVSAGKVVYVTATLPYVLLTILLVRGVTLEGSLDGIIFFLKPDFSKLLTKDVWIEAAVQVVFQLGPAWGSLITMARYNEFHHRCYLTAIIIPLSNLATAIYGGLAIFSVLGFMAHRQNVPVAAVAQSGPALAFVAYPEAIAQLPFPPFWSAAFFLVLITVAIDSQFAFFETIISGISDLFPVLQRHKVLVSAAFATLLFLLGLPLCTQGGMYLYLILDWYGAALTFVCVGFLEIIIIAYIYGLKRFRYDASLMFGKPPNTLVAIAWFTATPVLMASMTFFGLSNLQQPSYGYTNYTYPGWAITLGWVIGVTSFLPTPITLIVVVLRTKGSFMTRMKKCFQASEEWVPSKPELVDDYRRRWYPTKMDQDKVDSSKAGFESIIVTNKSLSGRLRSFLYDSFVRTSYHSWSSLALTKASSGSEDKRLGCDDGLSGANGLTGLPRKGKANNDLGRMTVDEAHSKQRDQTASLLENHLM